MTDKFATKEELFESNRILKEYIKDLQRQIDEIKTELKIIKIWLQDKAF